jgi:hypothetical protein
MTGVPRSSAHGPWGRQAALKGEPMALRGGCAALKSRHESLKSQQGDPRGQCVALRGEHAAPRGKHVAPGGGHASLRGRQGALKGRWAALRGSLATAEVPRMPVGGGWSPDSHLHPARRRRERSCQVRYPIEVRRQRISKGGKIRPAVEQRHPTLTDLWLKPPGTAAKGPSAPPGSTLRGDLPASATVPAGGRVGLRSAVPGNAEQPCGRPVLYREEPRLGRCSDRCSAAAAEHPCGGGFVAAGFRDLAAEGHPAVTGDQGTLVSGRLPMRTRLGPWLAPVSTQAT